MELLIVILLVVLICLLLAGIYILNMSLQRNQQGTDLLVSKNSESAKNSAAMDARITKEFDVLLSHLQHLVKNQATDGQIIDSMSEQIESMTKVMTNTKMRGNWGEYQLENLLSNYAGTNRQIFSMQYMLQNGKIADAVFHLPETGKLLCIDSKFPMENYLNLMEDPQNEEIYKSRLKNNVKKHVDDISSKYITEETLNQAILFLPSEAIYQYLCGRVPELIEYALHKHVVLASPTTLVALVYTVVQADENYFRASHIEEIERNLQLLEEDLQRLVERSEKAEKSLAALSVQFHQVSISANKLNTRFTRILTNKDNEERIDENYE